MKKIALYAVLLMFVFGMSATGIAAAHGASNVDRDHPACYGDEQDGKWKLSSEGTGDGSKWWVKSVCQEDGLKRSDTLHDHTPNDGISIPEGWADPSSHKHGGHHNTAREVSPNFEEYDWDENDD